MPVVFYHSVIHSLGFFICYILNRSFSAISWLQYEQCVMHGHVIIISQCM